MKNCEKNRDRLVEYYYSDMGLEAREAIEDHLNVCIRCRTELENLQKILDHIPRENKTEIPDAVRERMSRNVGANILEAPQKPARRFRVRWAPAMASLMVVLFVSVVTFHFLPGRHSRNGESISEEELELAENLELLENMDLIEILDVLEEMIQTGKGEQKDGGEL